VPALRPGGIVYDAYDNPEGVLGNWGEWTLQNTAQVAAPGLTYSDGTNSLQVSGNTMVAPIDWDPFENIPIKLFGDQTAAFSDFALQTSSALRFVAESVRELELPLLLPS
jgi:hypothetical protein